MNRLIIIFIFLFATLYAQACNYQEYYHIVAIAKKQCVKKDYKSSRKNFKEAFSKVSFPLGHDLSFALVAAKELKDNSWTEEISILLAKGGVSIAYFTQFNKMDWYKKFRTDFKKYNLFYQNNFNQELKEKWIGLILKDKQFNKNRYHAFREAKIKLTIEDLIEEASEISRELVDIVETYGFPGEQEMGYLYVKGKNRIENYQGDVLLRHIYQRGETVLEKEIPKIICEGKLRSDDMLDPKSMLGSYGAGIKSVMQRFYDRYNKD